MKRIALIALLAASISLLLLLSSSAAARIWTNLQGQTLEAEAIKVNPDRTVVLKTARGRKATLPFDTFIEEDVEYLENLLLQHERGKLHPVPWEEMNRLFGLDIWQDECLWDDPTGTAGERLEMEMESRTDFMENYRAYPLGDESILGEPVYTVALYGGATYADSLSMVFMNEGDLVEIYGRARAPTAEEIETCGERMRDTLAAVLGKPERDSLGKDTLREKVWRWDWNGHAIMLSLQEGKYVALRIMPIDRADRGGYNAKIPDDVLKERLAICVTQRDNGDVVIQNIPMIDQGPKGYCSPATWERYLRYLDIPADMYLLALAGDTGRGGGTYSENMIRATRNIVTTNGRKLRDIESEPTLDNISRYVDMGLPIMWRLVSDLDFRREIHANTATRKGEAPEKVGFSTGSAGHICLIIGYNRETDEIAVSDSYGPKFAERWVKLSGAQRVCMNHMSVIRW